jgi:diguanylate cyclase (GGDEF)-like protein/PAS domain S-box-containing protein
MAAELSGSGGTPRSIEMKRDASAFIVSVTGDLEGFLGWREDDLVGSPSTSFIHPQDQASAVTAWMEMLEQPGRPCSWRGRYRRADGEWTWVETVNSNRLDDSEFGVVLTLMHEIPEGHLSIEEQLRAQEELLSQLADALPVGIIQYGADRSIRFANGRLYAILGQEEADYVDQAFGRVIADDRARLDEAIEDALCGRMVDDVEVQIDGGPESSRLTCSLSIRPLTDGEGTINGAVATVDDVTDRARLRRQLEHQAMTDELTGCSNRRAILEQLDEAMHSQRNPDNGVAIVFIDLDDFKHVNDTYGHAVGDEVLAATAERLRRAVRSIDHVGRLGGDEFLVVFPDVVDTEAAEKLAERVGIAVNADVTVEGRTVAARASVGLAFTEEPASPDELIASADASMYQAKQDRSQPLRSNTP